MFYSISQLCKSSGAIFSYLKRFIDEFMSHIYLVLIQFISILIFFTFFIYIFQDEFFNILFIKIQVIQLSDSLFSSEKSGKIYFLEHSQLTAYHRLTFGLPQHKNIFSRRLEKKYYRIFSTGKVFSSSNS